MTPKNLFETDQRPNRRSLRLKGYDYAQAGAYFVTICTQGRVCLFGEVVDGEMRLNAAGAVVDAEWHDLPRRFPGVQTDAFVVMPNHVHGIIHVGARFIAPGLIGPGFIAPESVSSIQTDVADYDTGAINHNPAGAINHNPAGAINHNPAGAINHNPAGAINRAPTGTMNQNPAGAINRAPTVGDIVRAFKAVTTRRIRQHGMANFSWQRNYYEHIIRNEASLDSIREYIVNNPLQWALDRENPEHLKRGNA
jgi:REP element-mobilizing transposase RayT